MSWSDTARAKAHASRTQITMDHVPALRRYVTTRTVTARDVMDACYLSVNGARHVLNRLTELGVLVKVRCGVWEWEA